MRPDKASVSFKASVILPRLTTFETLSPELQQRWSQFANALEKRQLDRIALAYAQKDNLLATIKGSTCDTATEAANKFLAEIVILDKKHMEKLRRDLDAAREISFPWSGKEL